MDAFGDWREASTEHKAVSLYTAPVRCRGKAVGALTVGSTEADAFSGCATVHPALFDNYLWRPPANFVCLSVGSVVSEGLHGAHFFMGRGKAPH